MFHLKIMINRAFKSREPEAAIFKASKITSYSQIFECGLTRCSFKFPVYVNRQGGRHYNKESLTLPTLTLQQQLASTRQTSTFSTDTRVILYLKSSSVRHNVISASSVSKLSLIFGRFSHFDCNTPCWHNLWAVGSFIWFSSSNKWKKKSSAQLDTASN